MKGYINITMNGNSVGLKFAYRAFVLVSQAIESKPDVFLAKDKEAAIGDFSIEGVAKIIQSGYINNCIVKEVEPGISFEDFVAYVEDCLADEKKAEELVSAYKCFVESNYVQKALEQQEEKKKLIGIS
jgi:hypothetical protein